MSIEKEYVRGLRDVAACETQLSFVDPLGALYYVGYDIDRLLGRVCYEEVVHLFLYRKLPNQSELDVIRSTLISEMKIPKQIIRSIINASKNNHPIEISGLIGLVEGISYVGFLLNLVVVYKTDKVVFLYLTFVNLLLTMLLTICAHTSPIKQNLDFFHSFRHLYGLFGKVEWNDNM